MGHGSKRSKSLANKTSEKRITPNNKTLITKDTLNSKMKTSGNSTQPPNSNPIDVGLLERLQPDQNKTSHTDPPRRSRRHLSTPRNDAKESHSSLPTNPQKKTYANFRTWGVALTIAVGLFFSIGSGGHHTLVKRSLQFLPDKASSFNSQKFHTQSSSQSSDGSKTSTTKIGSDKNPTVEDIKIKVGVNDPGGTLVKQNTQHSDNDQNHMAVGVVEAPGYRFNMPKGVTPIFDNYRGSSKKKITPDSHSNREFDLAVKAVSEDVEAKFITNANIGATTTQLKSAVELLIQAQQQQQKDLTERSSGVIEMTHLNAEDEGLSDKITRLQDDLKPLNALVAALKQPTHQRVLPKLPRASSFSDSKVFIDTF
jgi:hypothetical protein